jgi:hypothetical protein
MFLSEKTCDVLLVVCGVVLFAMMAGVVFAGCGDDEPRKNGAACESDSDCVNDVCLDWFAREFHSGYCSQECGHGLECDEGSACMVDLYTWEHYCMARCQVFDDCREEYVCIYFGDEGVCLPEGKR